MDDERDALPGRLYRYIGPADFARQARATPSGQRVRSVADLEGWVERAQQSSVAGLIAATFIIDAGGDRPIADRRDGLSELLQGWSPDQYDEVAEMLSRMARRVVGDVPAQQVFVVAPRRPAQPAREEPTTGQPAER